MKENQWKIQTIGIFFFLIFGILTFTNFWRKDLNLALAQNSENVKPTPIQSSQIQELQEVSCSSGDHSSVEHCYMNGIHVIKIDLTDPNITIIPVVAPNGGLASLSSLAGSDGIAAINGDYRLGECTNGVNCGEGLTYVYGTNYTQGPNDTYNYRRSLAFNQSLDPHIGYPSEQGSYLWNIIGGGPRFTENGAFKWICSSTGSQNQDCPVEGNTVRINDEYFKSGAGSWYTNVQSAIGFSSDGNTIYFASSEGNVNMQDLHDVLWQFGSRNNLRLDGGSKRSLYYNDGTGHYLYLGSGVLEPNAWVITESSTPPSNCNPSDDQIALYVDSDYNGQCVVKNIGEYENPASIDLPNDSISSIKVGSNVQAVLCEHDNYDGICESFSGNDANLSDNSIGDNQVSSVKVETRCQNEISAVDGWTADGNWNNKTSFNAGDQIQWVITVENKTCGDADITLTYDVVGSNGQQVNFWEDTITAQAGTWHWGLPGIVSNNVGGTITFTGTVNYQGQVTQVSSNYEVTVQKVVPTPIGPIGIISVDKPRYQWTEFSGVTAYQIQLYNGSTLKYTKTVYSPYCNANGVCMKKFWVSLWDGQYKWRVRAKIDGTWGDWSDFKWFKVDAIPTPYQPSGSTSTDTPKYIWSKNANASSYQIQVKTGGDDWVYKKDVWSPYCTGTTCMKRFWVHLSDGYYKWRVRARVDGVLQSWSAWMWFHVE